MQISALDWIVIATYFAVLAAIGIVASFKVKDTDHYFMGKRRFGKLLLSLNLLESIRLDLDQPSGPLRVVAPTEGLVTLGIVAPEHRDTEPTRLDRLEAKHHLARGDVIDAVVLLTYLFVVSVHVAPARTDGALYPGLHPDDP